MIHIAYALNEIHKIGVVHRDLKPANIMFRGDDSLALADFGISKKLNSGSNLTDVGQIIGTPHYMSPEQGHAGQVDERGDLYSLGVVFFEMLMGEKPFIADSPMAVIYKHNKAPIPKLRSELVEYQELVDKMLAKKPRDRFQSMDELLACLDQHWPAR